jgi:hypothetical protein
MTHRKTSPLVAETDCSISRRARWLTPRQHRVKSPILPFCRQLRRASFGPSSRPCFSSFSATYPPTSVSIAKFSWPTRHRKVSSDRARRSRGVQGTLLARTIASRARQANVSLSRERNSRALTPVLGQAALLLYHRGYADIIADTRTSSRIRGHHRGYADIIADTLP